ncbi:MAG: hypothetical protein QOC92_67 [Acidimicrobiaceae bacterium]|jgi:hypothetical protein
MDLKFGDALTCCFETRNRAKATDCMIYEERLHVSCDSIGGLGHPRTMPDVLDRDRRYR